MADLPWEEQILTRFRMTLVVKNLARQYIADRHSESLVRLLSQRLVQAALVAACV